MFSVHFVDSITRLFVRPVTVPWCQRRIMYCRSGRRRAHRLNSTFSFSTQHCAWHIAATRPQIGLRTIFEGTWMYARSGKSNHRCSVAAAASAALQILLSGPKEFSKPAVNRPRVFSCAHRSGGCPDRAQLSEVTRCNTPDHPNTEFDSPLSPLRVRWACPSLTPGRVSRPSGFTID